MRLLAGMVVASLVLLAGCAATPAPSPGATAGATPVAPTATVMGETAVEIVNFSFAPQAAEASVGAKVIWTNNDSVAHTVTFDEGGIDSGSMSTGANFEHTFESAGTFAYFCAIHPDMRGTVTVGP